MNTTLKKPAAKQPPHVPVESEFWIFILGDMTVFAIFFGLWSWNDVQKQDLFNLGHSQVNQTLGLLNTLVLLTSSLCVALGLTAARADNFTKAKLCFQAAIGLGIAFTVIKVVEYREKILAGADIVDNEFFMYYFVFTGIHLLHVFVGMIALTAVVRRCSANTLQLRLFEGASVYWHMVDVLWIVLFFLIYLM